MVAAAITLVIIFIKPRMMKSLKSRIKKLFHTMGNNLSLHKLNPIDGCHERVATEKCVDLGTVRKSFVEGWWSFVILSDVSWLQMMSCSRSYRTRFNDRRFKQICVLEPREEVLMMPGLRSFLIWFYRSLDWRWRD